MESRIVEFEADVETKGAALRALEETLLKIERATQRLSSGPGAGTPLIVHWTIFICLTVRQIEVASTMSTMLGKVAWQ